MRSRVSREELIRRVVCQLLTSGLHAPNRYLNINATVSSHYPGGMTSQRYQGNNSQLFRIVLSIYDPLWQGTNKNE